MFNVGGGEVIVIMLIALIVLGPQRLPDAARQVGKALGDLRRLSTGFQNEMRSALKDADDPDRVAARRNVLAKELPRTPEDAEVAMPADDAGPAPTRTTPLRAAPSTTTKKTAPGKATAKASAAKRAAPKKAAAKASGKNGTAVKKKASGVTAKKPAAKAAPKAGARRSSS